MPVKKVAGQEPRRSEMLQTIITSLQNLERVDARFRLSPQGYPDKVNIRLLHRHSDTFPYLSTAT